MRIHIVCRNWQKDRVVPRLARYLVERLGWSVSDTASPSADLNYYLAYFEWQQNKGFAETPIASYLTHREETRKDKTKMYDRVAKLSALRVAMNAQQLPHLRQFGPTVQIPLPLELDHFKIENRLLPGSQPRVGVSGFTYQSGRKGEAMVAQLMESPLGRRVDMRASGRGWSCKIQSYSWETMPRFFQSLDIYLCTSTVEGGPMTTLEALATGCPVVIPSGVGIHDEIPDTFGIYRYTRGNYGEMEAALAECIADLGDHDREALRAATHPHSVQAWVDGNRRAFEGFLYDKPAIGELPTWEGRAGIYMVAFGGPSRECAVKAINSIHANMPGVPVALCSDKPLGPEDRFVQADDVDIGGRLAKLRVYDLAPQEWQYILYLDADTECRAPITHYFDLVADGWEFIICKDVRGGALMKDFRRPNNQAEYDQTIQQLQTPETLQLNGGVWSFRRCDRMRAFFKRWLDEWNVYGARDQGALIRALYQDPPRMLVLGNEWNFFEHYCKFEEPVGLWHWPQTARRWGGQIPGRLDSKEAWSRVNR
jgi:hypothetical protein